ncbi:tail fiber protein [soil metagenome]
MLKLSRRTIAIAALSGWTALHTMPAAAQAEPFLGQIMCAGFNFTPRGWAPLNGQIISIAENTALFALLGTTYGGDGRTTFALPDMRGRTVIHNGTGPGLTPRNLGETGGTETTTLAIANLPPHTHSFAPLGSNNDASSVSPAGKVASAKARTTLYTDPANIVAMTAGTTSATGSGVPVNNMQPYLTMNCFMALQGIFPARD